MRCCVPLCDISSETLVSKNREEFKPKAVTFHGFPTVARLKEIWLANLGIDKCNLPQGAVVCSQHFDNDNFYFTRANFRKLRYDAVPLEVVPKEAQFCVICLDTDCTLYPLRKHNLHKAYCKLTGISTVHKLKNVLKLCTECAQRLINCCKLEDKSLIARNLMLQLVRQHGQLTTQNIRALDRVGNNLTSDLVQRLSKPDYFGPYIKDNLEESDMKDKESVDKDDPNVKSEISDHNYSKLDDEIESDVDYEIERLTEFEKMCDDDDDDIKMNSKIVDDDKAKSCKVKKSTSSYDLTNHDETKIKFNGDSDELEGMHDDDVKTNNNIVDDDKLNNEIDSDVDYEIERLSEFEEMYDDDIKMKNRIVDDDKVKSRKVIAYTSTYGLDKGVDSDNFDGDYDDKYNDDDNKIVDGGDEVKSFEVEYLNNYFGEDIEYLQEDIQQVALAFGAKDIFGRNRCGNNNALKHISTKRQENEKCDLKIFQITRLSHEEAVAEIMKRKTQKTYLNSTFKCTDCYKGYSNKEAFVSHMEHHTEKFGPLTCEVCKTHKWDMKQLKHHQRNFHSLKYSCTLCPFVKTNKAMAVMHERWHRGLKYQCPYCCAEFIKHSTYMGHLRSKHPSDVICSHCGFSFVGQQGLDSHKNKMHPFAEPAECTNGPKCRRCGVQFASEAAFRQHLDVSPRHADDGSNDSDDTFQYQLFGNSQNQNRKKQIKHYRNIICEESPLLQCGEQVVGFRRYYRHLMQHGKNSTKYRGETAMCEHCGKLFKSHTLLHYHMPLHSGKRQFPCEECGKRFVLRKNLWFHARTHRPDRPRYACELCGKHFANKMGRARHKRIIHEAVKYTCDLCGKKFTTAFARKNHIIHVHGKVPWPKRVREPRTRKPMPQARRKETTSDSDTQ